MAEITRQADIIVVASGHPHTLTADMVKDGAVVIDVGVNRIPDSTKKSGFRLIGDCDFDDLKEKISCCMTNILNGDSYMSLESIDRFTRVNRLFHSSQLIDSLGSFD